MTAQKILRRILVEYHHGISAALDLVAGEATAGFALEWETRVGIFGATARLKARAGGGSALQLYVHRIGPNAGAIIEGLKRTSPFKGIPTVVVVVDDEHTFNTTLEIGMGAGVGELHVGGQVEVDVEVHRSGGNFFCDLAISIAAMKGEQGGQQHCKTEGAPPNAFVGGIWGGVIHRGFAVCVQAHDQSYL